MSNGNVDTSFGDSRTKVADKFKEENKQNSLYKQYMVDTIGTETTNNAQVAHYIYYIMS